MNPALGDHLNGLPPLLPREFLGHLERKKEDPPLPVMCPCYAGVKNCLHISNMLHRKRNLIDFDDSVQLPATGKLYLSLTSICKSFHYVLRNGLVWGKKLQVIYLVNLWMTLRG